MVTTDAPAPPLAVLPPGAVAIRSHSTRAVVDPLGAAVLSLTDTASGTEFLMRTPWAQEDWDNDAPVGSTSEVWHRRYPGGWHTLVPHAGEGRLLEGVTHPFHGEAAWRRWRVSCADESACRLEVRLRTAPLSVSRSFALAGGALTVEQAVENGSALPVHITWTEHPALGTSLIAPQTVVELGGAPLDLHFPSPAGKGWSDFRTEPSAPDGRAEVRNPETGAFARLSWDPALFPLVHVWQEHHGTAGFPWWGAASGLALEPASRTYWPADDRLGPILVPPGERVHARFELTVGLQEPAPR